MKISTKATYGMVAMVDIAANSDNREVVTVSSISKRNNISKIYLEQIVASLKKYGLIISNKGPHGGYLLSREAKNIKASDILRALEGDLLDAPIDKNSENDLSQSVDRFLWKKLEKTIEAFLDSVSLADLVDEYKSNNDLMFYI